MLPHGVNSNAQTNGTIYKRFFTIIRKFEKCRLKKAGYGKTL
jgi:hypothetical protein